MSGINFRKYEALSPFEIKDELIALARGRSQRSARLFLNAGRGNPNWIATRPREAFFLLGQFALTESRRVMDRPGFAGMPVTAGIAERLAVWLGRNVETPGAAFLARRCAMAPRCWGSNRTISCTSLSIP